jgi:hypothetical protein
VRTGWAPIAFTVETTSALNFESRSKIRKRCGSWLYSQVSRSCRATQKCGGITRYVVVKDSTTVVADDEKAVENAKSKRGYGEEVHRGNGLAMVPQERQPALRRVWSSGRSPKPSRDRRL